MVVVRAEIPQWLPNTAFSYFPSLAESGIIFVTRISKNKITTLFLTNQRRDRRTEQPTDASSYGDAKKPPYPRKAVERDLGNDLRAGNRVFLLIKSRYYQINHDHEARKRGPSMKQSRIVSRRNFVALQRLCLKCRK